MPKSPHIGTLAEKSLHAAIKQWLAAPEDRFEVKLEGFVIDVVRGEQLIEIQTRNFAAMKRKLARLLPAYSVRLIHPIPQQKWIVRQTAVGELLRRRKSPKKGAVYDLFRELVYIPHLLLHPNLTIEVLLTQEEEIWRDDGQGSWRRQHWSLYDRQLLGISQHIVLAEKADFLALLPFALGEPFTNKELAQAVGCQRNLAQKMTYALKNAGILQTVGKRKRAILYEIAGGVA